MDEDLAFAIELAELADAITRVEFEAKAFAVRTKADGTAVTDVDVRVENTLAERVAARYAADSFLGEEFGERTAERSGRRWIVDGVDGTDAFIRGDPTWGTLIALEQDGEIRLGVATSPGLGRRWWAARGTGAWTARLDAKGVASDVTRLTVSTRRTAPRGVVVPPAGRLDGWRDEAVTAAVDWLRPENAPGVGPFLVAAGELEVSVALWGRPWDYAASVVLVEEAGGEFSDLWGGRRLDTGTALFSNGLVHDAARDKVKQALPERAGRWAGQGGADAS